MLAYTLSSQLAAVSHRHPLIVAAWAVAAIGFLLFFLNIAAAMLRVGKQYGPAMRGKPGLRIAAAMSAAGARWYLLAAALAGLAGALLIH